MTGPPMTPDALPTMHCAVCDTDVPAGAFCGTCGAHLSAQRGNGRGVLRPGAYGAAPGERVLRLSVASSLFPHLPNRSRAPFRAALGVLFLTLIAFAFLGWQAPLIAVSALGFPLLFLLYLHESDIDDDLPASSLGLTAALGAGLGRRLGTADRRHRRRFLRCRAERRNHRGALDNRGAGHPGGYCGPDGSFPQWWYGCCGPRPESRWMGS